MVERGRVGVRAGRGMGGGSQGATRITRARRSAARQVASCFEQNGCYYQNGACEYSACPDGYDINHWVQPDDWNPVQGGASPVGSYYPADCPQACKLARSIAVAAAAAAAAVAAAAVAVE